MGFSGFIHGNLLPGRLISMYGSGPSISNIEALNDNLQISQAQSAGNRLQMSCDLGALQSFNAVAVFNHNLDHGGTLDFYHSLDGSTWTGPLTLRPPSFFGTTWTDIYVPLAPLTTRYVRFDLASAIGTTALIGEIVVGNLASLSKQYDFGYSKIFQLDRSIENINGSYYIENRTKSRGYRLPFSQMVSMDHYLIETALEEGYTVFVPDIDRRDCMQGVILDDKLDWKCDSAGEDTQISFISSAVRANAIRR